MAVTDCRLNGMNASLRILQYKLKSRVRDRACPACRILVRDYIKMADHTDVE